MRWDGRFLLFLVILLPLGAGLYLKLSPQTQAVNDLWQQVRLAEQNEDFQSQLDAYAQLEILQPWREPEHLAKARAFYAVESWLGAIESYNRVDKYNLEVNDYLQLAEACWAVGDTENARNQWLLVGQLDGLTDAVFSNLLRLQQAHQDWFGAYQTLLAWQAAFPEDNSIYYDLGLSQMIYDPILAEDSLIRSLETHPERIETVKAFQAGLDAVITEENEVMQIVLAGNLLSQQNEWRYAAAAYAVVLNTLPDYADAWALYGNAQFYLGEDGTSAIEKALALNPESVLAQAMYGYALRRDEYHLDSLNVWEALAEQEPKNALWCYEQGLSYALYGDLNEALFAYQEAAALANDDPYYWKQLAQFSLDYAVHLDSVGVDAARKALALNPDDAATNDLMGMIFLQLGDDTSAERFLLKAKNHSPYSALIHLHLGQLYIKQDRIQEARDNLNQCIALAQNEQIANLAKHLLANYPSN